MKATARLVSLSVVLLLTTAARGRDSVSVLKCKGNTAIAPYITCDVSRVLWVTKTPLHFVVYDERGTIVDQADGFYGVRLWPPKSGGFVVEVLYRSEGHWKELHRVDGQRTRKPR